MIEGDNGMKKKIIIFVVLIIVVVLSVIFGVKRYKDYKVEKQAEMERLNDSFLYSLNLDADCQVSYNKVEVHGMSKYASASEATIRICYYNYYNDASLSYEGLMDEYNNFCEGKDDYKNLKKYANYMMDKKTIPFTERVIGNLHVDDFIKQVTRAVYEECGKDYNQYLGMDAQEINVLCQAMLEREDEVYERIIVGYLEETADYPYSIFTTFDDVDDTGVGEGQEIVMESEDGNIIYHLAYGNVKWLTEEESWYVRKIEIIGGAYSVCKEKIGHTGSPGWADSTIVPYGFECTKNDENQIIYSRDNVNFIIDYNNDEVIRMTVEVVR